MLSNDTSAPKIRTEGSMSGERKRGQVDDFGTGTMAKAGGNRYSGHPRQPHLFSRLHGTLGLRASRPPTGLAD